MQSNCLAGKNEIKEASSSIIDNLGFPNKRSAAHRVQPPSAN